MKTYCILTPSQQENGENALSCTRQIVNVASCAVFGLQNTISSIAANIVKKWFYEAEKNWLDVNCSKDIYHIVDSDGKYVLHGNYEDYESGTKEVCTKSNRFNRVMGVPDEWKNYHFERNVFYWYVQAATFKKCTPNPKSDGFFIMMCSRMYDDPNKKLGFCENYSTANYLNVVKDWDMYRDDSIYFVRDTRVRKSPIKFTEIQSSKDEFFYLASDMSPEPNQSLQWYEDVRFENDNIYGRLVFGQESKKIAFKFEKVAAKTPNPQICKPTNKVKKEKKDKNNEDL